MNFSLALHELTHNNEAVTRKGWNGKNQFIYYIPAAEYPAQTEIAKKAFSQPGNTDPVMVPYGAYLAIKTVQGNVVPWLASQTDILADDWELAE